MWRMTDASVSVAGLRLGACFHIVRFALLCVTSALFSARVTIRLLTAVLAPCCVYPCRPRACDGDCRSCCGREFRRSPLDVAFAWLMPQRFPVTSFTAHAGHAGWHGEVSGWRCGARPRRPQLPRACNNVRKMGLSARSDLRPNTFYRRISCRPAMGMDALQSSSSAGDYGAPSAGLYLGAALVLVHRGGP